MFQEKAKEIKEFKMKKYGKLIIFTIIILSGFLLNRRLGWNSYLTNGDNLQMIKEFVENKYILSISLYLIFTILGSSILALPGATFAIVASGLFGPWLGSLYCLIGATIGALVSFLLSKYFLKETVEMLVEKNKKLNDIIFKVDPEKEMLILMITRLLPIFPFNLQNFAYGITNISVLRYTVGSFIFMIPGIVIFSIGTEGVINKDGRNTMILLGLFIITLMVIIGIILYKKYKTLMIEEQNAG